MNAIFSIGDEVEAGASGAGLVKGRRYIATKMVRLNEQFPMYSTWTVLDVESGQDFVVVNAAVRLSLLSTWRER